MPCVAPLRPTARRATWLACAACWLLALAGCPSLDDGIGAGGSGAGTSGSSGGGTGTDGGGSGGGSGGTSGGSGGSDSGSGSGGSAPAAPIFPDPGDGETNVPLQPDALGGRSIIELTWWAPATATRYVVEISRSASFPSSSTETWGAASNHLTFIILSEQYRYGTTYYWRVTAHNDYGATTTSIWSFTTEQAPAATPSLVVRNGFRPRLSPDASKVAFMRLHYAPGTDPYEGQTDVWVVSVDGSGLVRLTDTPDVDEFDPQWTPDGRRVAFLRTTGTYFRHDSGQLYEISPGGTGELLRQELFEFNEISFYKRGASTELIVKRPDGTIWMTIGGDPYEAALAHRKDSGCNLRANTSADTLNIVMNDSNCHGGIVLWDPVNLEESVFFEGRYAFPAPFLSPHGRKIVAGSDGGIERGLYTMSSDGTGLQRITTEIDLQPSWQQETIVFTRVPRDGPQDTPFGDIYKVNGIRD